MNKKIQLIRGRVRVSLSFDMNILQKAFHTDVFICI